MVDNGNGGNDMPQLPIFKGVNYLIWSLKMSTLFKSQDLWTYLEEGFVEEGEVDVLKEKKKMDAKALFIIQQALDDEIFPTIANATTSKQAWDILKEEYRGDKKAITVKLQSLRREYETAMMKEEEKVEDFLSRITGIVEKMKYYGEDIKDSQVVSKVLRSLTKKFDHVVTTIEELKDLEIYTFDELVGSLHVHGERMQSRGEDKMEENSFQVKSVKPQFDKKMR